ncbi:MAG: coiled-coil domain-containing protein [Eggerthellaceae bacterium]
MFESENLNELVNNLHYLDAVQQAQADEIELQRQRQEAFNSALDDLNTKKDEQMKKISEAEQKTAEAAQVVSNAETKLADAKDAAAEAERLAELKAQAEALAKEQEEKQAAVETPVDPEPETSTQSESADNGSTESNSDNLIEYGQFGRVFFKRKHWRIFRFSGEAGRRALLRRTAGKRWHAWCCDGHGRHCDRKLDGCCRSSFVAECPFVFGQAGRNQLYGMTVSLRSLTLRHGRRLALSRFATGRMACVWRKLMLRLGCAHSELSLPVRLFSAGPFSIEGSPLKNRFLPRHFLRIASLSVESLSRTTTLSMEPFLMDASLSAEPPYKH